MSYEHRCFGARCRASRTNVRARDDTVRGASIAGGVLVSEANEGSSELVSDGAETRSRLGRSVVAVAVRFDNGSCELATPFNESTLTH